MTISHIQSVYLAQVNTVSNTIVLPSMTVTAGDLVRLGFTYMDEGGAGGGILSIADSSGNTYTRIGSRVQHPGDTRYFTEEFYSVTTTGGASVVATGTFSLGFTYDRRAGAGSVFRTTTTWDVSSIDVATGSGSGTLTSGTLTAASGAKVVSTYHGNLSSTFTASSGHTKTVEGDYGGLQHKIDSAALSETVTATGTGGGNGVIRVAVFREASADTTAPTLSSPTSAATGKDAGSGTVTTNEANGTLYAVATLTATAPSAAQVKAGQNASGTGLAAGLKPTLAVSSTGAKTVSFTGLTTATPYYPYFAHEDSSANLSSVSSGAAFTPSTLAYSGTVGAQSGVQGFAFVWSGVNPSTLYSGGIGTKSYSGTGLGASGLTVNSSTGVLSGTCGTPGTYTVAIVGTDQSTAGSEIPQTETSNSFTLTISASGDTTRPTLTGVVTPSAVTASTATATWPAGADNAAIAGYDYQLNGGAFISLGNVLTVNLTGLTASTAYTINVRARDTSGNVSTPVITGGFTTNSASAGTFVSAVLKRNTGVVVASSSLTWVAFLNSATGAMVVVKTGISTNGSGVFSATDAALTTGTYHATWLEASGQRGYGVASIA